MKMRFLGTGTSQGIPVLTCPCPTCQSPDPRDKRLRVSVHLEVEGRSLVIDTGPDFRQQMLLAGVQRLDAVLLTHEHRDHIAGLDDLRAYNFRQHAEMPIYAAPRVLDDIRRSFAYCFSDYPGVPVLGLYPIEDDQNELEVLGLKFEIIRYWHGALPVLGYRLGTWAYITDIKSIEAPEKAKLKGLDILVLSALRHEEHHSHFNLSEALALIEELQPARTYLTHLSHNFGPHAEEEPKLPTGVFLAYDGLELDCDFV